MEPCCEQGHPRKQPSFSHAAQPTAAFLNAASIYSRGGPMASPTRKHRAGDWRPALRAAGLAEGLRVASLSAHLVGRVAQHVLLKPGAAALGDARAFFCRNDAPVAPTCR